MQSRSDPLTPPPTPLVVRLCDGETAVWLIAAEATAEKARADGLAPWSAAEERWHDAPWLWRIEAETRQPEPDPLRRGAARWGVSIARRAWRRGQAAAKDIGGSASSREWAVRTSGLAVAATEISGFLALCVELPSAMSSRNEAGDTISKWERPRFEKQAWAESWSLSEASGGPLGWAEQALGRVSGQQAWAPVGRASKPAQARAEDYWESLPVEGDKAPIGAVLERLALARAAQPATPGLAPAAARLAPRL
jgi:hypothetical protein